MDKFIVTGGNRLEGKTRVSGAKNAALPIMAASLVVPGRSIIRNVPNVMDVRTMRRLLGTLGAKVDFGAGVLTIDATHLVSHEAPYDLVKTMRASYYVLGPLLARLGQARVSLPGGCAIGARPIDLHLKGLQALGARMGTFHGYIEASARTLSGATMILGGKHGPSVGATINVMMAAVLARGRTIIEQAALEPEVVDVADFLNRAGAFIKGAGTALIEIEGVDELHEVDHTIIPDRIETGTLAVAGAITRGGITLEACRPDHCEYPLEKLRQVGVVVATGPDWIRVEADGELKPNRVEVAPYPGFPTDMQAQFTSLLTITPGVSVITETIFENRFMHVLELVRMGADIVVDGNSAFVQGVKSLTGAPVMASDLRASAALVLAGLVAEGETHISRVYHLDRGYEGFEKKLAGLGASISRVRE